ncbi:T9SS C-terminal target domain-containing protein [Bizionia argentinensis JUB59]|uniref:T9SS C-terminal target domain-containing protein n=1 Tax=Bizionia argentinensis JUB59 TaxID=1046627 RepID=G2EAG2_9FLAO|nr:T9SS C-terminal target domain-containing protein [Bizionia argentinensis]EGV44535.2 T9SS C-terminal target domain-containing protein [Bizionia argentinensis JUB59]
MKRFPLDKLQNILSVLFMMSIMPFSLAQTWMEADESENYTARHECGFVQVGDKFIMFGGRESSEILDIYDYSSDTWTRGGTAPYKFNHFQAVAYQGLIWVIGAFKTNIPNPEENADYVFMYNPATEQWIQGMEIPESRRRGASGLVVYNNTFYVVGGNNIGHDGGYVSYFDEFNPATGVWTALNNAPHERDHFQAVVLNNKLYAIGGRLTGGPGGLFEPQVPEVDVYNFSNSQWSTLNSSQNLPNPRSGLGVIVFNGEIFTIGGETTFNRPDNGPVSIVESYNPSTNSWTNRNSLNYARHGFQPIVSGNAIYVAGGASGSTSIGNMEYYGTKNPVGESNINSIFSADETTKSFEYGEDLGNITIDIILSNANGTTGTYIDTISISGADYSLANTYSNLLIGANTSLTIEAVLNNTTRDESNGSVTVTYNNNSTLTISLAGTLDPTFSIDAFENSDLTLILYPSPTKNSFSLNQAISQLQIFDISGKHIKEFLGEFKEEHNFNVSELPSGLYIVKARNTRQERFTRKFIKN